MSHALHPDYDQKRRTILALDAVVVGANAPRGNEPIRPGCSSGDYLATWDWPWQISLWGRIARGRDGVSRNIRPSRSKLDDGEGQWAAEDQN